MKISIAKRDENYESSVPSSSMDKKDYLPSVSFHDLDPKGLKNLELDEEVTVTFTGKISRISQDTEGWNCLEIKYKEIDLKVVDSKMSQFVSEIEDD